MAGCSFKIKDFSKFLYDNILKNFFMNTLIVYGILIEIGIVLGGIYLINKLNKRKTRQPALSRKLIRNLKL